MALNLNDHLEKLGPVVFCKDCVHYYRPLSLILGGTAARCLKTWEPNVDLVSGKLLKPKYLDMNRCSTMRNEGGACGKQGLHWRPRNKKDLFVLMKKESA